MLVRHVLEKFLRLLGGTLTGDDDRVEPGDQAWHVTAGRPGEIATAGFPVIGAGKSKILDRQWFRTVLQQQLLHRGGVVGAVDQAGGINERHHAGDRVRPLGGRKPRGLAHVLAGSTGVKR